jgi:hypothetical protein
MYRDKSWSSPNAPVCAHRPCQPLSCKSRLYHACTPIDPKTRPAFSYTPVGRAFQLLSKTMFIRSPHFVS